MTFRPEPRRRIQCLTLIFLLSLTPALYAQAVAVAEVDGIVTDPSAGFIAAAQVTMTSADTKAIHATVTDSSGHYLISNLPPGPSPPSCPPIRPI